MRTLFVAFVTVFIIPFVVYAESNQRKTGYATVQTSVDHPGLIGAEIIGEAAMLFYRSLKVVEIPRSSLPSIKSFVKNGKNVRCEKNIVTVSGHDNESYLCWMELSELGVAQKNQSKLF